MQRVLKFRSAAVTAAAVAAAALTFTAGCARVDVVPVTDGSPRDGVHFYRPWPYLLVTQGAKDEGPKASIIQLPDRSQEYAVRVVPGLGTANGNVGLSEGWMLSSLGAQVDTKIPETMTAASGLLATLGTIGILGADPTAEGTLRPGLYRILFNNDGHVSGVQAVNLTPQ